MLKLHYAAGFAYLGLTASLIARSGAEPSGHAVVTTHQVAPPPQPAAPGSDGRAWFARMKPYCNAVEVETVYTRTPPPAGAQGAGFGAACLALAGKVTRARQLIADLAPGERYQAAAIVFEVGHPVADAGDDRSAGPMMAMVVEFWPNNYMALYHAGMSEYALGQYRLAHEHLKKFLELYTAKDGWRSNAARTIAAIENVEASPQ